MTNTSEKQNNNRVLQSLAIAGFVGLLIVIAWLGVQLVGVLPNAFSSLASLANSVYHPETPVLTVASNKTITNSNESATISWNVPKTPGSFAFSYACTDGLAIDIRDNGEIKSLSCNTNYSVGSVSSVEIVPTTAKTRFTDLKYTVDFIASGKTEPTTSGKGGLTVVNPTISTTPTTVATSTEPVATTTPVVTVPVAATTTPAVKPVATTTKPATVVKKVVPTYSYANLNSNPNGFVDLMTTFVGTGIMDGTIFRDNGVIDNDAQGAIRFEVKNYGNKTAEAWTYVVNLPNGTTYTSPAQKALKPNERAVITIGFATTNLTGTKSYSVTANTTGDSNTKNNGFTTSVAITD